MQLRVRFQACTSPTAKPSSFYSKRNSTVVPIVLRRLMLVCFYGSDR
jgi:hypothetical protein